VQVSRRNLLRYGFIGAATAGSIMVALSAQKSRLIDPPQELLCLDIKEFSILTAVAERLLPGTNGFPSSSELNVALKIDALLHRAHQGLAGEIKLLLLLIENGAIGLIFHGNHTPFTQLSPSNQDVILADWKNSSIPLRRTTFKALNSLCAATYYSTERACSLIGYNGPPQPLLDQLEWVQSQTYEEYLKSQEELEQ
jgi:hypothetical protein